jgi:hypothetical protein
MRTCIDCRWLLSRDPWMLNVVWWSERSFPRPWIVIFRDLVATTPTRSLLQYSPYHAVLLLEVDLVPYNTIVIDKNYKSRHYDHDQAHANIAT